MSVVGNAEGRYEDAWIAALGQNADVSWAVRHWDDATNAKLLPAVLVYCSSVLDATSGTPDGYDIAIVEIQCRTQKDADKNKAVVEAMIGAVRDTMRSASILSWLEGGGGLDIYNVIQDEPSFVSDEGNLRIRSLTVQTYGTQVNLPPP